MLRKSSKAAVFKSSELSRLKLNFGRETIFKPNIGEAVKPVP